jgi:hypothetical protein
LFPVLIAGTVAFSGCKTIYSEVYSYKKTSFDWKKEKELLTQNERAKERVEAERNRKKTESAESTEPGSSTLSLDSGLSPAPAGGSSGLFAGGLDDPKPAAAAPSAIPGAGSGGAIPGMGGSVPGMGGSVPGMGGSVPGMGGSVPGMGGSVPGMGGSVPGMGGSVPGMGGAAPNMGGAAPTMGAPDAMKPGAGTNPN